MKKTVLICIILNILPLIANARDIHVPAEFSTIQEAINYATSSDTIVLADGVYTGEGNRNLFMSNPGIEMISANGPDNCIIDCQASEDDKHNGMFISVGYDSLTLIQGITFRNAYSYTGGGIDIYAGDPTISNCVFENNYAIKGGGIHCSSTRALITNCRFTNNSANEGGGVFASYEETIQQNDFVGNNAYYGGGICLQSRGVTIVNNLIDGNSATAGGGIHCGDDKDAIIGGAQGNRNIFKNNRAAAGSDLFTTILSDVKINATYNQFQGNPFIEYYVYPEIKFDVDNCLAGLIPIKSDLYVSPKGSNSNDGLTENTPFQTIDFALQRIHSSESEPLTIHLAEGVYSSTNNGEVFPILLTSYVTIQGAGQDVTILDAEQSGTVVLGDRHEKPILSDVTITGGYAESTRYGGGITTSNENLTISRCVILENQAEEGGGVNCSGGEDNKFIDCIISNNQAVSGGGLVNRGRNTLFHGCTIRDNVAETGGGIFGPSYDFNLTECLIAGNEALYGGGAGFVSSNGTIFTVCTIQENQALDGGGIFCESSSPNLERCWIRGNSANRGGAAYGFASSTLRFRNSLITSNTAKKGAGIYCFFGADFELINATIANNAASTQGGGAYLGSGCFASIDNSIIWYNDPRELFSESTNDFSNWIRYSCVYGFNAGFGCIPFNPKFKNDAPNRFSLLPESPCIDAGSNIDISEQDFNGTARRKGGAVDMGAHEFDGWPSQTRCYVEMPNDRIHAGDMTSCTARLWNHRDQPYSDHFFIVILDIHGELLFAPSFNSLGDCFFGPFPPGVSEFTILPEFKWPYNAGESSNIYWYAALTDSAVTDIFGYMDVFKFSWHH